MTHVFHSYETTWTMYLDNRQKSPEFIQLKYIKSSNRLRAVKCRGNIEDMGVKQGVRNSAQTTAGERLRADVNELTYIDTCQDC